MTKKIKSELFSLSRLYTDPKAPGSFGGLDKAYRAWKKIYPSLTRKQVDEWAQSELSYTLHRPSQKKIRRRKVLSHTIDYLWEADLVDMTKLSRQNKGYKFLLVVIDTFSKFAFVEPLKNKSGAEILRAFSTILRESKRKPQKLRTDQGTEFTNAPFQNYLRKQEIGFYTANSSVKPSIVERYNKTLKGRMYRHFTALNTLRYVDVLQDLVNSYNATFHRSIGMAPNRVSLLNVGLVRRRLQKRSQKKVKQKYKLGDYVRLSLAKRLFKKGYMNNFTEEIFVVSECLLRDPPVYKVKDLLDRPIEGTFYTEELQKVTKPDVFRVERILQRKKTGGKIYYKVRWKGYSQDFDSWLTEKELES